jgi:hypothetical protein
MHVEFLEDFSAFSGIPDPPLKGTATGGLRPESGE